jgi:arsenate reductase
MYILCWVKVWVNNYCAILGYYLIIMITIGYGLLLQPINLQKGNAYMITIYHNPRCSKSRQTLELLKKQGINPEIVLYLDRTPSAEELSGLLKKLGLKASQLIRKTESHYKEHLKNLELTENQLIQAMIQNPKLIERPIVVAGDRAALGRPPEAVLEII